MYMTLDIEDSMVKNKFDFVTFHVEKMHRKWWPSRSMIRNFISNGSH